MYAHCVALYIVVFILMKWYFFDALAADAPSATVTQAPNNPHPGLYVCITLYMQEIWVDLLDFDALSTKLLGF